MTLKNGNKSADDVYREPRPHIVDFAFDETVAGVFPDMIRRSVPGYETVIPLSALLAARYVRDGSRVYDLGCSLGATTLALTGQLEDTSCDIIAVDNSAAMIERAKQERTWDPRVRFVLDDVRETEIRDASVVLMNYVLQFIDPRQRLELLTRIHAGMLSGGALILSEKVAGETEFDTVHADFKRANGYSELEVSQKRTALENVMVPETLDTHIERLESAGFGNFAVWFRCLNWVSIIAIA